jgi:hypothetical protein
MFSAVFDGRAVAILLAMARFRIVAVVLAAILCAPIAASAVTVEQIVALSKAGVSEAVILALIDRDRSVLTIDPEQLVALKRDGLTDTVLMAMLKSGRDEAEDAARAVSAANAASVLASLDTAPSVVIVGHGPDRPNTGHTEDYYRDIRDGVRLPAAIPLLSPYAGGVFDHGIGARGFRSRRGGAAFLRNERRLCLAQVNTAKGPGPSYVTECPAIMQGGRGLR